MSGAAKTIVAFALYMAGTGAIMFVAPNVLLGLFGLPTTTEPWIRILGLFLAIVAFYYWRSAVSESTAFMRATVIGRTVMALYLFSLGVTYSPVLFLFGGGELLGAIATGLALRAQPTTSFASGPRRATE